MGAMHAAQTNSWMNSRSRRGRAAALVLAAGAAAMSGLLGGCAADTSKDDTIRALTDRNTQLLRELEEREAAVDSLQLAISQREGAMGDQTSMVSQLRAENERLRGQLADVDSMLAGMEFGPVDPLTSRELDKLAARYPDVLSFDAQRGLIRFQSDLTFDSGSAQVRDSARPTLETLASILNSAAGSAYDVRIVGHTDNQRISSGTAQRHPTNMHLSAHRAISVFDTLRTMGVNAERVEIAGRGPFAPVVANNTSGGTPQNRRVDIYLVKFRDEAPSHSASTTREPARTTPARSTTPAAREQDIMK